MLLLAATRPCRRVGAIVILLLGAGAPRGGLVAAEPDVLAVLACDPYAEVKDQLGWLGRQVGNPQLAGLAESFVMMATQFKGLAGLDTGRPLGVVLGGAGKQPVPMGLLPVKDAGGLLASLQGVIGPAERTANGWSLGGGVVTVVERDGWAIVAPAGATIDMPDPAALLGPLVKTYSLGLQLFPSRMPDAMRATLVEQLPRIAAALGQRANLGQQFDPARFAGAIESLRDAESLVFGVAMDADRGRMFIEARAVATPGSNAAADMTAVAAGAATVGLPGRADGPAPALVAHQALKLDAQDRRAAAAMLADSLPRDDADPLTACLADVFGTLVSAMLEADAVDAVLSLDTAGAGADGPLQAFTVGMRVADGAAIERRLRERLGAAADLPAGMQVKFASGKAGAATLHEIVLDLPADAPAARLMGAPLTLTVAVAPGYAFLLTGADAARRVEGALAAGGRPDAVRKPLAGVDLSLPALLECVAACRKALDPADPLNATIAEVAAAAEGGVVQLLLRPVDRGMAVRLSADAAALKTAASADALMRAAAGGAGPVLPGFGAAPALPALPVPIP
ncbi:MAG: hypothetical protein ACKOCW_00070 [Planctomycetaceae bacterium]